MHFPLPILLQKVGDISVYRGVNGSLIGLWRGRKVRVDAPQPFLPFEKIGQARELLANSSLFYDGFSLKIRPYWMKGGAEAEEIAAESFKRLPKRNPDFVGREPCFQELEKRLEGNPEESLLQVDICGVAGTGKSTLALEYLYRNRKDSFVWWFPKGNLLEGYREIGLAFGLIKPTDNLNEVLNVVKPWLEGHTKNTGWLFVLDDTEQHAHILSDLPETKGRLIITSKHLHSRDSLLINTFTPKESLALLKKLTAQTEDEKGEELAIMLCHLPLALAVAGAYMRNSRLSYGDYINLFTFTRESWSNAP